MISINMPVYTKDGHIIGQATLAPDGQLGIKIMNKDLLHEWMNLWTVGLSPGLKVDIHLIPAEETPRDQPLKEDRFGREPRG